MGKLAIQSKAQNYSKILVVNVVAAWDEDYCSYLGGLLLEILHKNIIESQVVKYLDHIDALCEAQHEIYAGNTTFVTQVLDASLGKIELPHNYYTGCFNDILCFQG